MSRPTNNVHYLRVSFNIELVPGERSHYRGIRETMQKLDAFYTEYLDKLNMQYGNVRVNDYECVQLSKHSPEVLEYLTRKHL